MTPVKVGETYRFEGVVTNAYPTGSADLVFAGANTNTRMTASEMAAATLIEKPYEPAVGDVVTWGSGGVAMKIVGVDGDVVWVKFDDGTYITPKIAPLRGLRRLPPETPLGPIAPTTTASPESVQKEAGKCTLGPGCQCWDHNDTYKAGCFRWIPAKADRP